MSVLAGHHKERGIDAQWASAEELPDLSDHDDRDEDHSHDDGKKQDVGRRRSVLTVLKRTRYLGRLSVDLQVVLARQLRSIRRFGNEDDDDLHEIFRAGTSVPGQNQLLILDAGVLDLFVTDPGGNEVFVGQARAGSIVGGLVALGLASKHLITVRRPKPDVDYLESDESSDGSVHRAGEHDPEREKERQKARKQELVMYSLGQQHIAMLDQQFPEEMQMFRNFVMKDLRRNILPVMRKVAGSGIFGRYGAPFVRRVTGMMSLRVFQPGELIFKEQEYARALAILICGKIDIIINGKFLTSRGGLGLTFGEAALLEDNARRTATVRCSQAQECLVCLLRKDDFVKEINQFPEERMRLGEHVRMHLTQLTLGDFFRLNDKRFLQFLAAHCQVTRAAWGGIACRAGEGRERLTLIHQGMALAQQGGNGEEVSVKELKKGDGMGFEAGLGLRSGPPSYTLIGGWRGCVLIGVPYEATETALVYFPEQLQKMLQKVGVDEVPADHPFMRKAGDRSMMVHALLCKAFSSLSIDAAMSKLLEPIFRVEVYDADVPIAKQGQSCSEMMLLLHGKVMWSRKNKVQLVAEAPTHFNEDVIMGLETKQTATITALSTCVVWYLPMDFGPQLQQRGRENPEANPGYEAAVLRCRQVVAAATAFRQSVQATYQARLRNMKLFRRLRSEILEKISQNVGTRTFLPHDVITKQGEVGDCMYILLQGRAEIQSSTGPKIGLEEGDLLGEGIFFGQATHQATACAVTLCVCSALHGSLMAYAFKKFEDDPEVLGWPHNVADANPDGAGARLRKGFRKADALVRAKLSLGGEQNHKPRADWVEKATSLDKVIAQDAKQRALPKRQATVEPVAVPQEAAAQLQGSSTGEPTSPSPPPGASGTNLSSAMEEWLTHSMREQPKKEKEAARGLPLAVAVGILSAPSTAGLKLSRDSSALSLLCASMRSRSNSSAGQSVSPRQQQRPKEGGPDPPVSGVELLSRMLHTVKQRHQDVQKLASAPPQVAAWPHRGQMRPGVPTIPEVPASGPAEDPPAAARPPASTRGPPRSRALVAAVPVKPRQASPRQRSTDPRPPPKRHGDDAPAAPGVAGPAAPAGTAASGAAGGPPAPPQRDGETLLTARDKQYQWQEEMLAWQLKEWKIRHQLLDRALQASLRARGR